MSKEPKSKNISFFNVFSLLYISSYLFHVGKTGEQLLWPFCLVVFITLHIFGSQLVKKIVFTIFLISSSIYQAYSFPNIANHATLQLFINIFLLTKLTYKRKENFETILLKQKNTLCYFLVWVYFIAGFHKLNIDFFNPDVSCANWYLYKLGNILGFQDISIPSLVKSITPYIVVVSEILGALLLLTYKKIGLIVFIIMHSFLSLGGFADFSAIAFSLLICFLPHETIRYFYKSSGHIKFALLAFVTALLSVLFNYDFILRSMEIHNFKTIQGVGFILSICPIFYIIYKKPPPLLKFNFVKFNLSKVNVLFLIILVAYSMNGYLGLNTTGTFSMFSNIKTENKNSNHLIMPNYQMFDYQKYNIEVLSTEPEHLEHRFSTDYLYPYKLFKQLLREHNKEFRGPFNIKFKVNNKIMGLSDKTLPNSPWLKYNSWLERYYLNFRTINKQLTPNECRW